jgi:hypothetical protein
MPMTLIGGGNVLFRVRRGGDPVLSAFWRRLATLFRELIDPQDPLAVSWSSAPTPAPTERPLMPAALETGGVWHRPPGECGERLREYAKQAALALGHALADAVDEHWYAALAREFNALTPLGYGGEIRDGKEVGSHWTWHIADVCDVSARYCVRLETEALARELQGPGGPQDDASTVDLQSREASTSAADRSHEPAAAAPIAAAADHATGGTMDSVTG